jgi:DNA-binding CsgD family transcriptional regulator/predicted negative regulator of RcsB-dependent stress response
MVGNGSRLALIERGEPWAAASHVLGAARTGMGSVLFVEGTSGLGKSALAEAIDTLARDVGMKVLRARGRRHERGFRYGVLLQILESGVRAESRDRVDLRAPEREGESGPDALEEPDAASFDELQSVYRTCLEVAETAPLVILVDDVDFSDEASLAALLYFTERIETAPIALVLLTGSIGTRAPAVLREIARHPRTTRTRLQPLTAVGTQRRLAKRLPAFAHEGVAEHIHLASGGNPFVLDELAGALAAREDTGAPTVTPADFAPESLADWALGRAADVDPGAPTLLSAVAVLGQGCELRQAAAVAGVDPELAGELLDRLVEIDLLAQGDDGVSFAQPAVAAAVKRAQPPGERAAANLRAARILDGDRAEAERVGDHLLDAARTASAWTVDALCMAAAVALGRGAPAQAVRYLRRALAEPPPRSKRAHVVLELGRAEAAAGSPDAATHLTAAVREVDHGIRRPEAALQAGRTLFALGRTDEAIEAIDQGLAAAGDDDGDLVERLRAARTTVEWMASLAAGEARQVPPMPDGGDSAAGRALLALRAMDGLLRGVPAAEVRDIAQRALGRGELLDEETSEAPSYYFATVALAFSEDFQMAEAALTAALEDAQARGSILAFATASHIRARAILMRGRLGDAARDARYGVAVERHGWKVSHGGARAVLATVLMEQGRLEAARKCLERENGDAPALGPVAIALAIVRGRLELYSGDADAALAHFLRCGELSKAAGISNPALSPWRMYAGLATAVVGDWAEGERLIQAELSAARDYGAPGTTGRTLRALASISEPAPALETLEAAHQLLEGSQAALERAEAMVDFGAALRRAGKRRDAVPMLREGLDLAKRCGADALVSRGMREAKAAGARPRRAALRGHDALTQREHQVATLAADGLTNRQIAEQLVVTLKTVEWHLAHAYTKLGVHSRRELAGKLDQQ